MSWLPRLLRKKTKKWMQVDHSLDFLPPSPQPRHVAFPLPPLDLARQQQADVRAARGSEIVRRMKRIAPDLSKEAVARQANKGQEIEQRGPANGSSVVATAHSHAGSLTVDIH